VTKSTGKLIALEGIDGSGTTTQSARLAEALRSAGYPVHLTREPSDGPLGHTLREILRGAHDSVDPGAVALLFAADRLDHLQREILPAIVAGTHVVTDRYVTSSLAYQSLTVDRAWVVELNRRHRPADLTVLLDLPHDVAKTRRASRGGAEELFDADAVQRQLVEAYRRELAALGEKGVRIDGSAKVVEVSRELEKVVKSCLGPLPAAR
jgi:dTMP kinase